MIVAKMLRLETTNNENAYIDIDAIQAVQQLNYATLIIVGGKPIEVRKPAAEIIRLIEEMRNK